MDIDTTVPHSSRAALDGARATAQTDCVPTVTVDIDAANITMSQLDRSYRATTTYQGRSLVGTTSPSPTSSTSTHQIFEFSLYTEDDITKVDIKFYTIKPGKSFGHL